MHSASQKINAIHSMLSAGQRNLRIERHTLILWGVAGGLLCLISDWILTPEQLPDLTQRAFAWLALLLVTFGGVAVLDWRLTRRAKFVRDEAWSFIHKQVIKIFWLLMGAGTLLTFAMFFFGGGYMIFGAWIILFGLGLYIHGLFSEEMLEWAGVLMILIGITSLASGLPQQTIQWIAASTFGIGCPVLALLLDRGRSLPAWKRLLESLCWIIAVLSLPFLAHRYTTSVTLPDIPPISLAAYRQLTDVSGFHVVTLPSGTNIPVQIEVGGNLFSSASHADFSLTTAVPMEVGIRDGKLTGDKRVVGESWLPQNDSGWVHIPWVKAELTPEQGALIRSSLIVTFKSK